MDRRYGFTKQSSGLWRSLRDGDFEEEDVWDVLRDRKDSSFPIFNGKSKESSASFPGTIPTAPRMIPRDTSSKRSSSSNNSSHEAKVMQQSAPVNIPDWSKISGKKSRNANSWLDDVGCRDDDHDFDGPEIVNGSGNSVSDDDDKKYNSRVPPYELVARRLARIQVSSFSVFEGVGRTLKGRDLSRVRRAVLTKTGFLE